MALVAAPLFALAGGALGGSALLGGTIIGGQIGMSVGWLVGSWLFAPKQQDQNQIFDPGAQELPPINQALRGSTMPMLFGTNRVSSNVIWRNDFTTTRNETSQSQGGGKLGGSGGKGGTATQTTVDYSYTIDILFHMGMVPDQYGLYGGWAGPERLSSETIIALQSNGNSNINLFTDLPNPNLTDQTATITFEDAYYYDGYGMGLGSTDSEGWPEITSDMGFEVRWPHTAWLGIKQLDLGHFPHIPQLSWEVGPGAPIIDFDSGFIDQVANTSSGNLKHPDLHQFIVGDDGHFYTASVESTNTIHIDQFNVAAGTYNESDTVTRGSFTADMKANGAPDIGYDYGNSAAWTGGMIQNDSRHFIVWGWGEHPSFQRWSIAFGLYKVDASGKAEMVGFQMNRTVLGLGQYRPGSFQAVAIANEGTDDDPIIFWFIDQTSGTITPRIMAIQTVNEMLFVANGGVGPYIQNDSTGDTNYTNAARSFNNETFEGNAIGLKFGNHGSDRVGDTANFGWFLPRMLVGVGVTWETHMFWYVGQAQMDGGTDSDHVQDTKAAYPGGWCIKMNYGVIAPWGTTPINPPSADLQNSNFIDEAGEAIMPFNDEGTNRVGDIERISGYNSKPQLQRVVGTNIWSCLWGKAFKPTAINSTTGEYFKVRGMTYNPFTEKFTQFAEEEGTVLDTVSDLGNAEGDRYDGSHYAFMPIWDQATGALYKVGTFHGGFTYPAGDVNISVAGSLDIGGQADILPPYIIFQVLTNPWFGIGLTEDEIDMTSYSDALAYCEANNFRVSTQYKRERQVLDIVDQVLALYGGMLVISDKVKFLVLEWNNGEEASLRVLDNHHFISQDGLAPVNVTVGARQDSFNRVKVNYIDRSLSYVQNQVEISDEVDQDLNGTRTREFPPQFVMGEQMAATMAERALWSNLYSKDTYSFQVGWQDADLEPGDVITVVDSFHPRLQTGETARIVKWQEAGRGVFDVIAKQEHEYILTSSGEAFAIGSASNNPLIGPAPAPLYFRAYELPCEFSTTGNPGIFVGWVADEFASGANLYVSGDGISYSLSQNISPYPIAGTFLTDLPIVAAGGFNENVEVVLAPKDDWVTTASHYYASTLPEASAIGRANGTSLLWVGSEMVAYENITLVAQNQYKFSRLYRGWGETPIQNHSSGDYFWKHGGGIFFQPINEQRLGTTLSYKVQPVNQAGFGMQISSIDAQTYTILGTYYTPQNPTAPQIVYDGVEYRGQETLFVNSTIDIQIDWDDSAGQAGYGYKGYGTGGYGDSEIDVRSHQWRVEVAGSGDIIVRSTVATIPSYTYTSSANFEDNGAWRGTLGFIITAFNGAGDSLKSEVKSVEIW